MRYRISHLTSYEYSEPVSICHNEARLVPLATSHQRPLTTRISIEPTASVLVEDRDYFGNVTHFFTLQEAHLRLAVTAVSEVEVNPYEAPALSLSMAWEAVRDRARSDRSAEGLRAFEYSLASAHPRPSPLLLEYASSTFSPKRPLLEAVYELTKRIHTEFRYLPGSTTVSTPVEEVFEKRQGVCQDFAHLEIAMLRGLGLPACYVSGYVNTAPAPGQPKLQGADASHAWISVWCPGFGYVDFDPTNGTLPRDEHITLARGRDFADVSPIRGVILGGGDHRVRVAVDVHRV